MARSHKILIIDDDPDYIRATRRVLERHYAVSCAHNGKEGWQRLKEDKPDLIILDVLMEKKTEGFEFSRELRKERAFHDIPIIMLTGMRQQTGFFFPKDQSSEPRLLPTDLFMEKPVSPTELLINIENVFKEVTSSMTSRSRRERRNLRSTNSFSLWNLIKEWQTNIELYSGTKDTMCRSSHLLRRPSKS